MIAFFRHISAKLADGIRTLKVSGFTKNDIRTAVECLPYGVDSCPVPGVKTIYAETLGLIQDAILGYNNTRQKAAPGESRLFSTDADGAFKFTVWLTADGNVLIGTSEALADYTKHLTQYEALKTAFDQLKTDHNNLVSAFNSHQHATAGTGSPSSPTPIPSVIPATPSSADMSSAKIDHLKTTA